MLVINFIGLFFFSLIFTSSVRGDDSANYPDIIQVEPGIFKFGQIKYKKQSVKFHFPHSVIKQVGLLNMLWSIRTERYMNPSSGLR